ncbi:acireductone synthase [Vampirovibrio chlorellavorus]|uniref:acireductone synthase n=1 Tax=Vampirovibrio chlorellavorus TaxID=758823 RepID=UPI0026F349B9|nr:acireductone synthase [Vampirovibrio chlorellavorus]
MDQNLKSSPVRFVLLDIEGTTTDIHFVHQVLFPYSAQRLPEFVKQHAHDPLVREAFQSVRETISQEEGRTLDEAGCLQTLLDWIATDRKHTALKQLQGMIWKTGFEQGDYRGHVYDDVLRALQNWTLKGIELGIYSSGSVQAQKLLFSYSEAGDLTRYFSRYFDTRVGAKRDVESYRRIVTELNLPPMEVLFLSDVETELDAARLAGLLAKQIVREGTTPSDRHAHFKDLLAVEQLTTGPQADLPRR